MCRATTFRITAYDFDFFLFLPASPCSCSGGGSEAAAAAMRGERRAAAFAAFFCAFAALSSARVGSRPSCFRSFAASFGLFPAAGAAAAAVTAAAAVAAPPPPRRAAAAAGGRLLWQRLLPKLLEEGAVGLSHPGLLAVLLHARALAEPRAAAQLEELLVAQPGQHAAAAAARRRGGGAVFLALLALLRPRRRGVAARRHRVRARRVERLAAEARPSRRCTTRMCDVMLLLLAEALAVFPAEQRHAAAEVHRRVGGALVEGAAGVTRLAREEAVVLPWRERTVADGAAGRRREGGGGGRRRDGEAAATTRCPLTRRTGHAAGVRCELGFPPPPVDGRPLVKQPANRRLQPL